MLLHGHVIQNKAAAILLACCQDQVPLVRLEHSGYSSCRSSRNTAPINLLPTKPVLQLRILYALSIIILTDHCIAQTSVDSVPSLAKSASAAMRIRHRSIPLLLLLTPCLKHTYAIRTSEQVAALAEGRQPPKDTGASPSVPSSLAKSGTDPSVGTKDAPVDGKDGRPHQGPFIETSAERDRKKAKENGDDESASTVNKPPIPEKFKEASYKDGWKIDLPETNDGVMDDPNRSGPKEGTRGTEGGISEKSRDGKTEGDSGQTKSEKKPDPPKEAPPLPHGEQEKLGQKDSKESKKTASESKLEEEDESNEKLKDLGGLEVILWHVSSSPICADYRPETRGSSRKASRSSPSCSGIIYEEELPRNARRLHAIDSLAHNIRARFANSTPSLLCPILHHDCFLRNWRQDLLDRCANGDEAPAAGGFLGCILSIDCNDHPFRYPWPRCTNIDTQTLYQLPSIYPILNLWS